MSSMDRDLNKEIKRISNLGYMKDKGPEFLEKQARINLQIREFKSNPIFSEEKDQSIAEEKFKYYLNNFEIESLADIDTLKSLIFNEVLEYKIQQSINANFEKNFDPSDKLTKQLTDIQNQKLSLKVKLGIDLKEAKENELNKLEVLKKRFEKHINENRHEFTIACPCGKLMLLRRRVKDFECFNHPWFSGRWYFNYEIMKDVKNKKISKEQAAKYCKTSIDYIDYCLDHWSEIIQHLEGDKK